MQLDNSALSLWHSNTRHLNIPHKHSSAQHSFYVTARSILIQQKSDSSSTSSLNHYLYQACDTQLHITLTAYSTTIKNCYIYFEALPILPYTSVALQSLSELNYRYSNLCASTSELTNGAIVKNFFIYFNYHKYLHEKKLDTQKYRSY